MTFLITVLLCIASFLVGFLAASFYFERQERETKAQWAAQKKELQRKLKASQDSLEIMTRRVEATKRPPLVKVHMQPEPPVQPEYKAAAPGGAAKPARQTAPKVDVDAIYHSFAPLGTLKLEFQYSFPEQLMFREGTGYVYNAGYELIPERAVFSRSNNAMNYAMSGLFFVYDVVYHGREYTFQQIMNGELSVGYVRIHSIVRAAKIRQAGSRGYYALEKKGKLKIIDL